MHQPKEWVLDILWQNVYDTKAEGINLCVFFWSRNTAYGLLHS